MFQKPTRAGAVLGVAVCAVLALSACSTTAGGGGAQEGAPSFAFITGDISDFGQTQIEGMKSIVEPLGGSITVLDGGTTSDAQNQDCLDAVHSGRYNGIILNPASGPGGIPCVDAAREAGIPVSTIETVVGPDETKIEPQVEGVVASAAFSNEFYGGLLADNLVAACADFNPCNYIYVVGFQSYQLSAEILRVVDERVGDDPKYNLLAIGEDEFNPDLGRQVISDLVAANPDVNVIANSSDSTAVQVVQLLQELNRTDVVVLGDGGSRQGLAAVEAGDIQATAILKPFTMGAVAADALVKSINGEAVPSPKEVAKEVSPESVTIDNVGRFEGQWG